MKYLNLLMIVLLFGWLGCSEADPVGVELEEESIAAQQDATALAKKPLRGTTYADFNPGYFIDSTNPSWVGTITIDGEKYGLVFYSTGSGKPFPENARGNAFFGEERFEIYSWMDFDFETQTLTVGDLLMRGVDAGVVAPNGVFQGNGVVEEANGDMAIWEGRKVHFKATVEFHPDGFPLFATGVFRVN